MIRTATKSYSFDSDTAKALHHRMVDDVSALACTGQPVRFALACIACDTICKVRDFLLAQRMAKMPGEFEMTTTQAIKILDLHSIAHRFESGKLMVRIDYTFNGILGWEWIVCPESYRDLMFLLGY